MLDKTRSMLIARIADRGPSMYTDEIAAEIVNAEAHDHAMRQHNSNRGQQYDDLVRYIKSIWDGELEPQVCTVLRRILARADELSAERDERKPE